MKNLNNFKFKITTLSPLHIGTGDVYEPTNFVIDNGYLYEFDESLFLQSLSDADRSLFNRILDNYIRVIDFYKNHKDLAKKIAYHKIKVTKKVENKYDTIRNKDNSKNKNLFEIQKTYKSPNTHKGVILGSSLKGMLDTLFQIYPQKLRGNEERQKLIVSDFLMLDGELQIGYSYRRHKNPERKARNPIPQIVEIINKNSSFVGSLMTKYSFEEMKDKIKRYFDAKSRANTFFKVSQNSFVARVGKFSGKAFMVDDGKNVLNNDGQPVATHTLYEDDSQFGWIKIELISSQEYEEAISNIDKKNQQYYDELKSRQYELKDRILKQKIKRLEEQKERELKKIAEQKEKERLKQEEEKRLASLSPFELKIEELKKEYPDPNVDISVVILKAIEEDKIDEKIEALQYIKKLMMENKDWKETTSAKNPKKDKKHQKTLKIIGLLKQYKG